MRGWLHCKSYKSTGITDQNNTFKINKQSNRDQKMQIVELPKPDEAEKTELISLLEDMKEKVISGKVKELVLWAQEPEGGWYHSWSIKDPFTVGAAMMQLGIRMLGFITRPDIQQT